jgi:hypothetical protein
MNNKQARKTGRTILCCGCILIVLSQLWLGLAMVAVGILFSAILGRCPHCGRVLLLLPSNATHCPKCHGPL